MIEVDNKKDLERELHENEKVLVLFYASWCPYCMKFVPAFNKQVSHFTAAKVVHVLLDDYDNPLWDDYDIEAVPTAIFFEDGRISRRLDGKFGSGLSERELTIWLEKSKIS